MERGEESEIDNKGEDVREQGRGEEGRGEEIRGEKRGEPLSVYPRLE